MRATFLLTPAAVLCGLAPAQDPKPAAPADVPALIRQLGSSSYAHRETAGKALAGLPAAFPALQGAAADPNPEVARRAGEALAALRRRLGASRLKKLPEYAKARRADRMAEVMAAWPEAVTLADRELPRNLAREVVAWAGKEFGPGLPDVPVSPLNREIPDDARLRHARRLLDINYLPSLDLIAGGVDTAGRPGGSLVVRGPYLSIGETRWANGDVRIARPVQGSVGWGGLFVCNGDFGTEFNVWMRYGVFLCTGDVRVGMAVTESLVVAGGDITFGLAHGERAARARNVILRPREPKLAEFLAFYDCAAEGLHVRAEGKNVFVTRVDPGTPFAAAGVRPGDRVVRVGDAPVRTVRDLNRLLCRAEVGYPGTAALFLARGEQGVDAVVTLADLPTLSP